MKRLYRISPLIFFSSRPKEGNNFFLVAQSGEQQRFIACMDGLRQLQPDLQAVQYKIGNCPGDKQGTHLQGKNYYQQVIPGVKCRYGYKHKQENKKDASVRHLEIAQRVPVET